MQNRERQGRILVAAKLLIPLGNPPPNGVKYFATKEVLELAKDEKRRHRMTVAIYQHWHNRNARKKERSECNNENMSERKLIEIP